MSKRIANEEAFAQNTAVARISQTIFALDSQTPSDDKTQYKPLYYGLYNGISTILETATDYEQVLDALRQLQAKAEDAYIEQADEFSFKIPETVGVVEG